uniref:uncharacterized protein LOC120348250 n=1 Tax=Styela clava TaxID=7725 RepID=UPI00193A2C8A|nr:uncharacterized protein LOC120348250 [Styela clava]
MGISRKKQRRIISQSRLIDKKIKMEILKFWKNNNAKTQDKESLREELLELAGNFIGRTAKSGEFRNRNFKLVSSIVAAAIPDEDWLEFSRTKLKLRDKDIENIIGRHGEFSDEFKYQLIKELQQEFEKENELRMEREQAYRCIKETDDWGRFVRDEMGISRKKQRRIIGQSRLIDKKIKMEILKLWKNDNAKTQDKESLREELLELAGNFIGRTAKSGEFRNRNFKLVSSIVAAAIPDEDWLEFSRTKLKLRDKDIENIIGRHGEFSDEFKYQLIKKLQQEEMEDPSWQKWELQDDENSSDIPYEK